MTIQTTHSLHARFYCFLSYDSASSVYLAGYLRKMAVAGDSYFIHTPRLSVHAYHTMALTVLYISFPLEDHLDDLEPCWPFFKRPMTYICPPNRASQHAGKLIYHCLSIVFPGKTKMSIYVFCWFHALLLTLPASQIVFTVTYSCNNPSFTSSHSS